MSLHYIVYSPDDNLCRPDVNVFHDEESAERLFHNVVTDDCDCDYCVDFKPALFVIEMPCLDPIEMTVTDYSNPALLPITYPVKFYPTLTWDGLTIPSCHQHN